MNVSEMVLGLSPRVRDPIGAGLVRLPWAQPKLVGFLASPAVRADPWEIYRYLRENAPVLHTSFGATIVSRHADTATLLRSRSVSVDESRSTAFAALPRDGAFSRLARNMMLWTDPPDHERLRRLVAKAFTPRQVSRLEGPIQDLVTRRVDARAAQGHIDMLAELAYPLPVQVICELFGVPADDHALLIGWAKHLAARIDVSPVRSPEVERAGDQAAAEFQAYLHEVIADSTRRAPDALIDALVAAEDDGEHLTRDEVVATCALVLLAGFETTANLIGNGLVSLLGAPDQLGRVRDGSVPIRLVIEELLRHDGPVQLTQRVAVDDTEVGGRTLRAGTLVVCLIAAANRDPDVFDRPEALDVGRDPNPHLAFSTGIHSCLGASLARLESAIIISHLIERFPRLRVVDKPVWRDSFVLRGVRSLHIAWT